MYVCVHVYVVSQAVAENSAQSCVPKPACMLYVCVYVCVYKCVCIKYVCMYVYTLKVCVRVKIRKRISMFMTPGIVSSYVYRICTLKIFSKICMLQMFAQC